MPSDIKKRFKRGWFGKWHYFYETPKGIISLVRFNDLEGKGIITYEIFCVDGTIDLQEELSDTERFHTKKLAEERIKELLCS
jgi:hypothetical protein